MIFGTLNPEKIWHENLTDLSISPVSCSHLILGNLKKVIFNIIIHTYFWLLTLSHKKTICNPFAHPTWKCHHTNLWTAKLFPSDWRFLAFFQTLEALKRAICVGCCQWHWKEPVVMCATGMSGKQCRSTFCINTCFQSFSTLISHVVHHTVLKLSPCRNKLLPQASTRSH